MDLFTLLGRIKIESGDSETEIDNMIDKEQTSSDFIASEKLRDRLVSAAIHPDVMGSDHCPVELVLE